jgi:hypothetical protein
VNANGSASMDDGQRRGTPGARVASLGMSPSETTDGQPFEDEKRR